MSNVYCTMRFVSTKINSNSLKKKLQISYYKTTNMYVQFIQKYLL